MHTGLIHTRGATLLEVMVALVIFSIGMLGLAALQITGMQETGHAETRTQATLLANDMVERMRANSAAITAGDYAAIDYGAIDCNAGPATYCEDHGGTAATSCTPAQMAAFDANIVYCQANSRLPSAAMSVQCTDASGTAQACGSTAYWTLRLSWVKSNDYGTSNKNLALTFRP